MSSERRGRTYEKIKAGLLAEAEAVGVHTKGAPLDPVLELLVNGFARELESVYDRVDEALEHNRRTLLRNYFETPFLESPAQAVVTLQVKQPAPVGPGMRVTWQRPVGGMTPEYALLGEQEMVPLDMSAVFYWSGNNLYRLRWDAGLQLSSARFGTGRQSTPRPRLLLGFTSPADAVDSGHLSFLLHPNDTGLPGIFPGSDAPRSFANYLDAAVWVAGDAQGHFTMRGLLPALAPAAGLPGSDAASRFPTEGSFFARAESEHLYAPMLRRFAPGFALQRGALPAPLDTVAVGNSELADVAGLSGRAIWLQVQLPYLASEDPRNLFSLIAANARLAIGYRRDPRDRFNYTRDDYNLQSELFEFGLADRPGHYCRTFGRWVVSTLADHSGNEYPFVYDAFAQGSDRWFTLEAGPDDVTLMVHVPRRKVPDVGHFDLYTGRVIGSEANTSRLDVLAPRPANALDFPEVEGLRLLTPARGGGDGYPTDAEAADSFAGGSAAALARQYERTAVWLRTRDRLITVPDVTSHLRAMDARVRDLETTRVALERDGRLVPGIRIAVGFDENAQLPPEEQEAICRMATCQIERRLPVGVWVEVRPRSAQGPAAEPAAARPGK